MLQFNSLELWPRMIHHVVKSCCNICLPYCLNKMWIAVTKYLPDDVRPFWSKQWRFLVKKLHFCPIVQRWTLLPAPSLLLFQSRQTKSWNCVTFKAFPAFQRVLVACGAACDVRRGVRSCEAPTSKSDGSAPYAAPPSPHVGARFSALPHALLVVLVHTLANFEFYTWTKKHTISLLQKPVGLDINVHTSKKCKILL